MELIFRFEYLNIKGAVWGKVLHCPGSQDCLMVLVKKGAFLHLLRATKSTIRVHLFPHRSHAIDLVAAA